MACLAACHSTSGSPPELSAQLDSAGGFNLVLLTWSPSPGAVSYVAEMQIGGSEFQEVARLTPVSFSQLSMGVAIADTVPEAVALSFRVRADPQDVTSNVATVHWPLVAKPPLATNLPARTPPAFHVTYARPAGARVFLERRVYRGDDSAPWTQLAEGTLDANTYDDADLAGWVDKAQYQYRTSAAAGNERSSSLPATTAAASQSLPELSVLAQAAAVEVTVTNHSVAPLSAYLSRPYGQGKDPFGSLHVTLTVPALGTSTYLDTDVLAGAYSYGLETTGHVSPPAWALVQEPASAGTSASLTQVPTTVDAVRAPSGFYLLADLPVPGSTTGAAQLSIVPPGGAASDAYLVPGTLHQGTAPWRPALILDRAGHLHTVYAEVANPLASTVSFPLVHAWHDGARWNREVVAQRDWLLGATHYVELAVGVDGELRVLWMGNQGLEVATHAAGAWTVGAPLASPPARPDPAFSNQVWFALAVDDAGFTHAFHAPATTYSNTFPTLTHYFADASGWQSEPVAGGVEPRIAVAAGGRLQVLTGQGTYVLFTRGANGWTRAVTSLSSYSAIGRSADETAIVVANDDGSLWTDGPGGAATLAYWPTPQAGDVAAGAGLDGKAWVLAIPGLVIGARSAADVEAVITTGR